MKNIICISGDLGSGKSRAGKLVAEKLNFEYISGGQMFRRLAEKMNISVLELNKLSETDESIDNMVDSMQEDIGRKRENILLDSRMAWFFVKDSFKVYLTIDLEEAARRVLSDARGTSESYKSIDEAKTGLKLRREAEAERYLWKYGADICNLNNYHLVIDTTQMTPEGVAEEIISGFQAYLCGKTGCPCTAD